MKAGTFGGGGRVRGALPGIGQHLNLSNAMQEGVRLGGAWLL
jgi:hypothetical protein